ncbi:caspase domain-containing protein [Schizophyllum commune]
MRGAQALYKSLVALSCLLPHRPVGQCSRDLVCIILLRFNPHTLCPLAPLLLVYMDNAAVMPDSSADFEVERYSTSSASSSETSLSQANDIRGRRTARVFKTMKEALMVPRRVSSAIRKAEFEPSLCTGRKKAVCIGINYKRSDQSLQDVYGVLSGYPHFLDYEGFDKADIRSMTDRSATPDDRKPTKKNILAAIKWLIEGAQKNDTLFFHCDQAEDLDRDEIDCLDEAFVPCDCSEKADLITDDVIYAELVKLPKGCRLTVNLPCAYRAPLLPRLPSDEKIVHVYQPCTRRFPLSTCADVVFWSGCKDSHKAADKPTMTTAFINTMSQYNPMLKIHSENVYDQPIGEEEQKPQLGSSFPMDTETPFFISPYKV